MTSEEIKQAMKGLDKHIDEYAQLLVDCGLNVQEGQEVAIFAPVEAYDFARRIVEAAYKKNAGHVSLFYNDDIAKRMTYNACDVSYFEHVEPWRKEMLDGLAQKGASFLFLTGRDPSVFSEVDPKKTSAEAKAEHLECKAFRHGLDFAENVWCIAGVPVVGWAKTVFPHAEDDEALYKLWKEILSASRVLVGDPRENWATHDAAFKKNLRFLNEKGFSKLHYVSKNGTDFYIGLPKHHVWEGGATSTVSGVRFFPNIPTEEVFTTPDRMRCEGVVHSALPLVYQGSVIDDFWLRFENGKVVEFDARIGRDVLEEMLNADENARRLGECALISKNTPIRESGVLFYNTLYDENASCHLALGMGFPECIEHGLEMSSDELLKHGVNQSTIHVDFMIGSDDLTITGITENGEENRVFVNGQWAWE